MKLKQQPEDFQVEELTDVRPGTEGVYAFYRLEKTGWGTPEALAAIRRRWRVEPRRLSYGGLKDRHAQTIQYLTIQYGPRRNLTHHQIQVEYLGQLLSPYTSREIRCNRFQITLRDLAADVATNLLRQLNHLQTEGIPNYFDDQRFGSVGSGEEFMARLLVRGQFEQALRLALTAPYEFDRAPQKEEKRLLVEHWGDWANLKDRLPRGHARSLVDYLRVHPTDFRGAVARLKPELRTLYLSAYQSHLWNRMLALWLRRNCRPEQLRTVELRLSDFPVPEGLDAQQRQHLAELWLPLPSARLKLDPADPRGELIQAILAEEGIKLHDLQVRGLREMFFSKGERAALCLPAALSGQEDADEHHPGQRKLTLRFELPRGCYATLVVKRLLAP
jgi:tRNA pseudouridine13 synthase